MSAIIVLQPLTDRGRELMDKLEQETDKLPFETNMASGARRYWLEADQVDTSGFDAMLDKIAPDWREHIARTA